MNRQEYIDALVSKAPKPTAEQLERIRALLPPASKQEARR